MGIIAQCLVKQRLFERLVMYVCTVCSKFIIMIMIISHFSNSSPSPFLFFFQAQAQEMMWEKDILRRAEDEDISELDLSVLMDRSHQAKSVAECYRPVRELVDDEIIKKYLPDVWVALIKVRH